MSVPILSMSGVTRVFGEGDAAVRALDDVDVSIGPGELVVVMGPSGSGKTTLLQIAGTLLSPTWGEIRVDGERVTGASPRRLARVRARRIGFVFQSFNLLANLDAEANADLPGRLLPRTERRERAPAARRLEELGLGHRLDHRPDQLSGGQRQRVAIARALANDPGLILADEPTGNLDSRSGYLVLHLLEQLARERGKAVLVVTHDHRIASLADVVLWLEDGRFGPPPAEAETVVDPVCGMEIQADRAAAIRDVEGHDLHFCSEICAAKFDRDPRAYSFTTLPVLRRSSSG